MKHLSIATRLWLPVIALTVVTVLMTAGAALLFWRPGGAVATEPPAIVRIVKQEGDSAKKKFDEAKRKAAERLAALKAGLWLDCRAHLRCPSDCYSAAAEMLPWTPRNDGDQVSQLVIHFLGLRDGLGDFLAQHLPVTPPETMDRDAHRAFI